MGILTKLVKYGIVFALGYYLGSSGCTPNYNHKKYSNLEQEVLKYEQNISKGPEYARVFFKQS
jgi:hypothetical protein